MKNRIREALSIRNMKAAELAERSGLDKAAISNYIKQNYQPKQHALFKMAKILDVNEMWLAGYDVPMERRVVNSHNSEMAKLFDNIIRDKELYNLLVNITKLNNQQLTIVSKMVSELVK